MFRAIGNWVFVRRDEQKDTHEGLNISEKAQVKSYEGTVVSSGSDKFVTNGDRVFLPHYQVIDYDIDGEEFAVVKDSGFSAKEKDGSALPVNKFVHLLKCQDDDIRGKDGSIVLHMTDGFKEQTNWCEIIGIADDCEVLTKDDIGSFCFAPENHDLLQRVPYTEEYMLKESLIEFTTEE
jgi:co-chaperonin GroES (HSP10)